MKKIGLILTFATAMVFAASLAKAQTATICSVSSKMKSVTGIDSVICISTTANYLYSTTSQAYRCGSLQAAVTRVSTAIGGTFTIQASNDNSNWFDVPQSSADTVTVSNAATFSKAITISPTTGVPYKNYRLKITGASSDTMVVKGWVNWRY